MSHKFTAQQINEAHTAKTPKDYRKIDPEVQPQVCDSFKRWDNATHAHLKANGNLHAARKCVQCGYPERMHPA